MNSKPTYENNSEGVRVVDNNVVFVSGQLDLDEGDLTSNRNNLASQTSRVVTKIKICLEKVEASLKDLVKLVVYYIQDDVDEVQLRQNLGKYLGVGVQTAVTFVPIRQLRVVGALIEIEAVAIGGGSPRDVVIDGDLAAPGAGFCHGLTCNEFSFLSGQSAVAADGSILYPGDLVSQNRQTIENLQRVLQALKINDEDIVKVNSWRAPASDTAAYKKAATDRFRFLAASGPAVTGITIPRLDAIGHQIRLDLWAMDRQLPRTRINPTDHWGWKIAASYSHGIQVGSWLFVGGQAALDQNCVVQHPEDTLTQIEITRDFIESIFRNAQGECEVVKTTALYCDGGKSVLQHQAMESLQDLFQDTHPAQTFVPVDHLAYPHQKIEIDAIARTMMTS